MLVHNIGEIGGSIEASGACSPPAIRVARFGNAPFSSNGMATAQSAASHPMSSEWKRLGASSSWYGARETPFNWAIFW